MLKNIKADCSVHLELTTFAIKETTLVYSFRRICSSLCREENRKSACTRASVCSSGCSPSSDVAVTVRLTEGARPDVSHNTGSVFIAAGVSSVPRHHSSFSRSPAREGNWTLHVQVRDRKPTNENNVIPPPEKRNKHRRHFSLSTKLCPYYSALCQCRQLCHCRAVTQSQPQDTERSREERHKALITAHCRKLLTHSRTRLNKPLGKAAREPCPTQANAC